MTWAKNTGIETNLKTFQNDLISQMESWGPQRLGDLLEGKEIIVLF